MCNIYGGFKRYGDPEDYMEITPDVESLKMRGRDSFGSVRVFEQGGCIKMVSPNIKSVMAKSNEESLIYFAFESRAIPEPELIEHAKSGLDHSRDTQPFENDEWVTSHNGTVVQPERIVAKFKLEPIGPVDSAILPELFKQMDPVTALREHLNGSYALAAYSRKEHALYLCATFQPLYYVEKDAYIYYASLGEQLLYLGCPVVKVAPYTCIKFAYNRPKEVFSLYRTDVNKRVMIICSGGLDSVTTARLYQVLGYEVTLLHFLYGQAAEGVEFDMIKRIAKEYNYPLMVLDVRSVFAEAAKSSRLLKGIPDGATALDDAEGTPSYVGNRNMIFGSIAAGIAEENGIGRVIMGLNLSDGSAYPDNCLPYLRNMEETLQTSLNQQKRVLFRSPFVNLMKHEILQIALAVGSPLHLQASCYYPTLGENGLPVYCDGCGSHLLRSYAFKHLGIKDPVPYKQKFDWEGCRELTNAEWVRILNINYRCELKDIPFAKIIEPTL